jgi:1,4-alpha-glucan branching enzyme
MKTLNMKRKGKKPALTRRPGCAVNVRATAALQSMTEPGRTSSAPCLAPVTERVSFKWHFPNAKEVFIAGSFNDWQPSATPLKSCGADWWLLDLELKPGRYEYRFVVDGQWMDDPTAAGHTTNSTGGRNSLLIVNADATPVAPARACNSAN